MVILQKIQTINSTYAVSAIRGESFHNSVMLPGVEIQSQVTLTKPQKTIIPPPTVAVYSSLIPLESDSFLHPLHKTLSLH